MSQQRVATSRVTSKRNYVPTWQKKKLMIRKSPIEWYFPEIQTLYLDAILEHNKIDSSLKITEL
jgi:hypothetical protein